MPLKLIIAISKMLFNEKLIATEKITPTTIDFTPLKNLKRTY
jgi:hypothetical protein